MSKCWIVGDLNLFSRDAARQLRKTPREYNKFVIQRINEFVKKEDSIILCGIINEKNDDETIELLKQIDGEIIILSRDNKYKEKPWNCFKNWRTDGWSYQTNYNGNKVDVLYLAGDDYVYRYSTEGKLFAAPTSIIGFKEKIQDKILNISFKALDYYPLELNYISRRIEDLELFESMNNEEENYAEQTI